MVSTVRPWCTADFAFPATKDLTGRLVRSTSYKRIIQGMKNREAQSMTTQRLLQHLSRGVVALVFLVAFIGAQNAFAQSTITYRRPPERTHLTEPPQTSRAVQVPRHRLPVLMELFRSPVQATPSASRPVPTPRTSTLARQLRAFRSSSPPRVVLRQQRSRARQRWLRAQRTRSH